MADAAAAADAAPTVTPAEVPEASGLLRELVDLESPTGDEERLAGLRLG